MKYAPKYEGTALMSLVPQLQNLWDKLLVSVRNHRTDFVTAKLP